MNDERNTPDNQSPQHNQPSQQNDVPQQNQPSQQNDAPQQNQPPRQNNAPQQNQSSQQYYAPQQNQPPQQQNYAPQQNQPQQQYNSQQQPYQQNQPQPKKSNKGCLIAVIVFIAILALIGLALMIIVPRLLGNVAERLGGENIAGIIDEIADNDSDQDQTETERSEQLTEDETMADEVAEETTTTQSVEAVHEDAEGEDLAVMPRYPGSVRVSSTKIEYGNSFQHSVDYLSSDDTDSIRDYIENYLEDSDWNNVMSMKVNDEIVLSYERQNDDIQEALTISIKPSSRHDDQSEIMLFYQSMTE